MMRQLFTLLCFLISGPAMAERVTVAVAANFLTTAENLVAAFEAETDHKVVLVHGSTGKLYAQIMAGAPYDVFLSADSERPARLVIEGRASGLARPYAFGRLALVLRGPDPESLDDALARTDLRTAIADPAVAPYGVAAREVLQSVRGDDWAKNVVFGESVAQAFAFIATGNTEMALIALSLTFSAPLDLGVVVIPEDRHSPLRQDAVLLSRAANNPAASEFFTFLDNSLARDIIMESGYGVRE